MSGQALIVGMGAIGNAVARRCCADPDIGEVVSISRVARPAIAAHHRALQSDHSSDSIRDCVDALRQRGPSLSHVIITLGTLHGADHAPEKALRQIDARAMAEVHRVNCVLPMLWLAALQPLLRRSDACRVLVLSARVGSIGDNRRGGWYSYRGAKAALNMSLRSAAIELANQNRAVKLIAYHPGTVDSALSAPFQARLPESQLFTPEFAAERLLAVMAGTTLDATLSYLDWAGETVPW